jgi:predicted transcriptional regulator
MKTTLKLTALLVASFVSASAFAAEDLDAATQAKVDAKIKVIQSWAANAAVVSAVKAQNTTPPADMAGMTQDKWKSLTVLDPVVRAFTKNAAAEQIKSVKDDSVSEAFVSSADGTKVAFLSKPSNWSHKGKAKHDDPMAGKTWQGAPEVDESTGAKQVQVAVPVLDGDKPIGSLVVGLNLTKLAGN